MPIQMPDLRVYGELGVAGQHLQTPEQVEATRALAEQRRALAQEREARFQELKAQRQTQIDDEADQAAIFAGVRSTANEDGTPNFERLYSSLSSNPRAQLKAGKLIDAVKTSAAKRADEENKARESEAKLMAQLVGGVDSEASLQAARGLMRPEVAQHFPEHYDPATFKPIQDRVMAMGTSIAEQNKIHDEAMKRIADGDYDRGAALMARGITSDQDFQKTLPGIELFAGSAIADRYRGLFQTGGLAAVQAFAEKNSVKPEELAKLGFEGRRVTAEEAEKKSIADTRAGELRETARYHNLELGERAREFNVKEGGAATGPGAGVNPGDPNKPHGAEYLATLPPADQNVVKSLAEGRMAFPSSMALRSPYWAKIIQETFQYDPSLDLATVNQNARSKVRQDFTSGKSSEQIRAMNTAVQHLNDLSAAADALHNTRFTAYNEIANKLATSVGWTGKTDFDSIAPRVAEEITRIWRGTGGSEKDIERDLDTLSTSKTPAQLHGAIGRIAHLFEGQIDSMQAKYQQGMGTTPVEVIAPDARKALSGLETKGGLPPSRAAAKASPGPSGAGGGASPAAAGKTGPVQDAGGGKFKVRGRSGKVYTFPSRQAADSFAADDRAAGGQ